MPGLFVYRKLPVCIGGYLFEYRANKTTVLVMDKGVRMDKGLAQALITEFPVGIGKAMCGCLDIQFYQMKMIYKTAAER